MSEQKIIFPYYKFSREELEELKEKNFMKEWTDETNYVYNIEVEKPNLVKDPKGNIWTLDVCLQRINQQLEFGNKKQVSALKALEFFNYLYNLGK